MSSYSSFLLLFFALPAAAGTTTDALYGPEVSDYGSGSTCLFEDSLSTSTSDSFTTTTSVVAEFTNFDVWLSGRHGGCEVYLDTATLKLNGTTIWSQFVDVAL